jgi:hypothetical protein
VSAGTICLIRKVKKMWGLLVVWWVWARELEAVKRDLRLEMCRQQMGSRRQLRCQWLVV